MELRKVLVVVIILMLGNNSFCQVIDGPAKVCAGVPVTYTFDTQGAATFTKWTIASGTASISSTTSTTTTVTWSTAGQINATYTPLSPNIVVQQQKVQVQQQNVIGGSSQKFLAVTLATTPVIYTLSGGGTVCQGTGLTISLSGSQTGITYQLYRSGTATTALAGTGSVLNWTSQTVAGTYTVIASSTGCSKTMSGSPVITVNPLPTLFTVGGGGTLCSGMSGLPITLSGSTVGVNYQLRINGSASTTLPGTGSALTWANQQSDGYSVIATNATTGCSQTMTGNAAINASPSPTVYPVTGVSAICTGQSVADVVMSTTQSGVSYQLFVGSTASSSPQTGNGGSLTWIPITTPGVYTVKATTTAGCSQTMSGNVTVTTNALPTQYTVSGNGSVCFGGSTNIQLSGSQTGVSYQVYAGSNPTGAPVAGTGSPMNLPVTAGGVYTVKATSAAGCTQTMSGNATITLNTPPTQVTVSGGGSTCTGGASVAIHIASPQTGVSYQPFIGTTAMGTAQVGAGSALTWSFNTTGTYTLVGTLSGCATTMTSNATISSYPIPAQFTVGGGGGFCVGSTGASITLSGSESGVNYQLFINSVAAGATVPGAAGSALTWTNQTALNSTYTIVATNATTGCTNNMSGSATIFANPTPTPYAVNGGGSYCTGGSGLSISLLLSESGTNYQLVLNGSNQGGTVAGTGAGLQWDNQTTGGTYYIIGTNSYGCQTSMTGTAIINVIPVPNLFTVSGPSSSLCYGYSAQIFLSGSEASATYQLQFNNTNLQSGIAGTGNPLSWTISALDGNYTVTATNQICSQQMSGSASITTLPLPQKFELTGGGSVNPNAAGNTFTLSGSETNVQYTLVRGTTTDSVQNGTGGILTWKRKTVPGVYKIMAKNLSNGCVTAMNGEAIITGQKIPEAVKLTQAGVLPSPAIEQQFLLSTLTENAPSQDIFPAPPCIDGNYIVGFQLQYDLGDKQTTVDWLSQVNVTIFHGDDSIATLPLVINMKDQTFIASGFYDQLISCSDNYRFVLTEKQGRGVVPEENIYLKILLFKNNDVPFSIAQAVTFSSCSSTSDQAVLNWSYLGPASEYDVEWVYVSSHDTTFNESSTPAQIFQYKEPVRITTAGFSYNHQLFYDNGRVWFRIRAVGYSAQYPDFRIQGLWNYSMCSPLTVNNQEPDMNWQEQTVFAEDGKYKKVLHYYDGSMRERQGQTNLSTNHVTLVGETFYDFEGRKSVDIMPVPAPDASLTYKTGFNQFAASDNTIINNTSSTQIKFNFDNYKIENSILSNLSGAGNYYSPSNLTTNIHRDYIPDSQGYPYSQTTYTNDGTGRISKQSGVGQTFRTDGDHVTRYFYGSAAPAELVRLFGTNVGNASHYKKNMVVDPNGQVSITYLDQEGRTVATALAGDNPSNVDPLTSYTSLDPSPVTLNLDSKNSMQNGNWVVQHSILNTVPNTSYTFNYKLAALASQIDSVGCEGCAYDLKITISDPDGTPISLASAAGNQSTDTLSYLRPNITAASCSDSLHVNDVNFTVSLPDLGDYTFTKILMPHELSFDQMQALVSTNQGVQNQIAAIQGRYVADPTKCTICTTPTDSLIQATMQQVADQPCQNIYNQIISDLQAANSADSVFTPTQAQIAAHPSYCQYTLCRRNEAADIYDMKLATISTWTAAVAAGYTDVTNDPLFKASDTLSGHASLGAMQANLNDVQVGTIGYDSNGDGVQDGSTLYHGPIAQVTDPSNTSYYVDSHGNPDPTTGYHLLYSNLMSQRATLGETTYQAKLDTQRWTIYRGFYDAARVKTKESLPDYTSCQPALADLQAADGSTVPTTPDAMPAWAAANGVKDSISAPELAASLYSISNACGSHFSSTDSTNITNHLQSYFDTNPNNFFHMIINTDVTINSDLEAIQLILNNYHCSLDSVSLINPLTCSTEASVTFISKSGISSQIIGPVITPCVSCNTSYSPATPGPANPPEPPGNFSFIPSQLEYDALIDLYNATNGSQWTNQVNNDHPWNPIPGSAQSVYNWYGITLDNAGHVISLEFGNNNLNGYLPASIGNLTYLTQIGFSANPNLGGTLPGSIGNIASLTSLFFVDTGISGTIPPQIGNITSLQYLTLSENLFTGCIPSSFGNLSNLILLDLSYNQLSGSIPESLGNLNNLIEINLVHNLLCGSVPSSLINLSHLQQLVLNNNRLSGHLPLLPSQLRSAAIDNNKYTFSDFLPTFETFRSNEPLSFAPQDSVDYDKIIKNPQGYPITFTATVDIATTPVSQFTWYRYYVYDQHLSTIPIGTGPSYTINNPQQTDVGYYYYKITNPQAPGLTLISRVQKLNLVPSTTYSGCQSYNTNNPTLQLFTYNVDWNQQFANCMANAAKMDSILTQSAVANLMDQAVTNYYNQYSTQCLQSVKENLAYTYTNKEYHYTLYYFDQAGGLVQTVPPQGVNPLTNQQVTAFLTHGTIVEPSHTLLTRYQYNSLDQLINQSTPDAGASQFFYNSKGQLRLSQNAQQLIGTRYSFTKYDDQARIIQVGELTPGYVTTVQTLTDSIESVKFPVVGLTDLTTTNYDKPNTKIQSKFAQSNLRTRVSWVEVTDPTRTDTVRTYYSYDIHGNVNSLLQNIPGLKPKRTDYAYDLVSGKVNFVLYQFGQADQFVHQYQYDADNRITDVLTSSDRFIWNEDANYNYYLHGPLARTELGQYRVQGLDYYYTLQGWIKGVNMPYSGDPGTDGIGGSVVGKDVFAYSLGYYQNDYSAINNSLTLSEVRDQLWPRALENIQSNGLYNGNISYMTTDLSKIGDINNDRTKGMQGMLYRYDQLHRITKSLSLSNYDDANGFPARNTMSPYDENYSYDANGNILTLQRNDQSASLKDDFNYTYYANSNKLQQYQSTGGTYQYDAIGNLTTDTNEGVTISWTPYGKVRSVQKGDTLTSYRYDGSGNRIEKKTIKPTTTLITRYLRDASGNVMTIYKDTTLLEQPIYGSSRIGLYKGGVTDGYQTLGKRNFEVGNHLGNVLAVITDNAGMQADSVWATVVSTNDYYPFGLEMKGRSFSDSSYRYGFNGKEKDGSFSSTSDYDFGARMYNPIIGRFLSRDKFSKSFPFYSPYSFAGNSPISAIDINGDSIYVVSNKGDISLIGSKGGKVASERIGRDLLLHTEDGRSLLTKYENSSTHDIYVTITPNLEMFSAGAETLENGASFVDAKSGKVDFSAAVVSSPGAGFLNFLNFDGLKPKNPSSEFSMVVVNSDYLDGKGPVFSKRNYDKFDHAESFYHEMMAHIELSGLGMDEHKAYGFEFIGIDKVRAKGSPAELIAGHLRVLRSLLAPLSKYSVAKQDKTRYLAPKRTK